MSIVAIKKIRSNDLELEIETILELIEYRPIKNKILLKPNLVVAALPEEGAITHPKITKALVEYFRKKDRDVVIAEGTGIFSTKAEFEKLLRTTGYDQIRDQMNVPIINLEEVEREKMAWRYGFIHPPQILKDYEYINLPTIKTHLQTLVTLGVKNQKGLIPIEEKKMFHKKNLHSCIYELSQVIQPSLTLVDGIYCIEGTGPTGPPVGEVKRMDLLVAGKDMMAVDNVCTRIMGFDVGEVKHLRPVKDIEIAGSNIADVRSDFKRPVSFFNLDRFVMHMDERACTLCTVSFYKALSKLLNTPELYTELANRYDYGDIHMFLGPGDAPGEPDKCNLCIGDCSHKRSQKAGLPHIKGCPPDYREIVNYFIPKFYSDNGTSHR